jgi:hypothetical protein
MWLCHICADVSQSLSRRVSLESLPPSLWNTSAQLRHSRNSTSHRRSRINQCIIANRGVEAVG